MLLLKGLKRVRDITGTTVKNHQGEELGFVYDLMITNDGYVKYAILSYDEFLGVGDRLIPIPWRMLTEESHEVVIEVDRKILDDAPNFDSKTWHLLSDAEWQETIEKYFENLSERGTRDRVREGVESEHRPRVTH